MEKKKRQFTKASLEYIANYNKEKTTGIYLKLNNKHDADIIEKLKSVDNKQGYIKNLIRSDLGGKIMMYVIRDREAGNVIDKFATYEEAEKALEEYENVDRADNIFTKDFYEICKID